MNGPNVELPQEAQRFFWDIRLADLSWTQHRAFIIERLLSRGDWDSIRWLRSQIDDTALLQVLRATRGRRLTPQQLRLWQLLLDIPAVEVDAWIHAPSRTTWDRRSA